VTAGLFAMPGPGRYVSFPPVPSDQAAAGQPGHITSHNQLADDVSALQAEVLQLQAQVIGAILPSSVQNVNYTLAATDLGTVVEMNSATAVTVTIPPSGQVGFPVGAVISVAQMGIGVVTLVAGGGVTMLSAAGANVSAGQYTTMVLRQRALNVWVVGGDIT
jgi:hypothetical protein